MNRAWHVSLGIWMALAAPAACGAAVWSGVDPVLLTPGLWSAVEIEQKFTEADLDSDGAWSPDEAESVRDDVWWTSNRFKQADRDGNGTLTLSEVETQRDWESRHPEEFRRQLKEAIRQELIARFGPDAPINLDDIDADYLEAHPQVAEWMASHVRASRFLYFLAPAREYLLSHPELRDRIHAVQAAWEASQPAGRARLVETSPDDVTEQRAAIEYRVLRSNEIASGSVPQAPEPGAMTP